MSFDSPEFTWLRENSCGIHAENFKMQKRFPFAESKLKGLQGEPGQKQTWFFDEKVEGLALVVTGGGAKVFYYKKWTGDGKIEKKLGRFDPDARQQADFKADPTIALYKNATLGLEDARQLARAVTSELSSGRNPWQQRERYAPKALTVAEMFDIYVRDHLEGKRKRVAEAKAEFERDCLERFGDLALADIDGATARAWHKKLTIDKGPYTANRRIQLMRALYNKAVKWQLYEGTNPFANVALNPEKERQNTITEKQLADLWNALESSGNSLVRDWGRLLLLTGARKSELCRMRWDCLDLNAGRWLIEDTKNGEARTVALGDIEVEILKERAKSIESPWVFPSSNGKPLKDPKKGWSTVRLAAGVPDFTIHDARRQLGTMLARSGADLKVVQKALGHKDIKTTMKHYRVASEDDQREAKTAARGAFLSIAEATKGGAGERIE